MAALSENICRMCPRNCGVSRPDGICRMGENPVVARCAPHFGEEPCISGTRGSGAVFFCGCNLGCIFCQNHGISRGQGGKELTVDQLADAFLRLQDQGVHNINLVTATHFTRQAALALEKAKLSIPVVFNSGGYDSVDSLRRLDGLVSIYLPDMKYSSRTAAAKYSRAPDYPETAARAIAEMFRQTGPYVLDGDGIMSRGVIIRHLILPGEMDNTFGVIDWVAERFPEHQVMFSLMSQYTPVVHSEEHPNLNRRLTQEEYDRAESYLSLSGIEDGYFQDLSSAEEEYIPAFDCTGL